MALSKAVISNDGYINRQLTAQLKTPNEMTYKDAGRLISQQIGFEKIKCLQMVAPGKFQITFYSMKHLIVAADNGLKMGSEILDITPMYSPEKNVLIRNCPFEMPNEILAASLNCYGKVGEIVFEKDNEFGIFNGNRRCKIIADKDIPNFIRIGRYNIMLTYSGVKPLCRKCHMDNHLSFECETDFCKKCFSYGHIYEQCTKNNNRKRKAELTEEHLEPQIEMQEQNIDLTSEDETIQDETRQDTQQATEVEEAPTTSLLQEDLPPLFSDVLTRQQVSPQNSTKKTPELPKKDISKEKVTILQNPLQNVQTSTNKKKKQSIIVPRNLNFSSPVKTRNHKKKKDRRLQDDLSLSEDSN